MGEERGGRRKGESRSGDGAGDEDEREIKNHEALFSSTPVIPRLICVSGSWCESLGATTLDSSVIFECVCVCVYKGEVKRLTAVLLLGDSADNITGIDEAQEL